MSYKLTTNTLPEVILGLRNIPAKDRMATLMRMNPKDLRALCNSSKRMRNWCAGEAPICRRVFPSFEIALKNIFDAKYTYTIRDAMKNQVTVGVYGAPQTRFFFKVRPTSLASPDIVRSLFALRDKIEDIVPKSMITRYKNAYFVGVKAGVRQRDARRLSSNMLDVPTRGKLSDAEQEIQKFLNTKMAALGAWNLAVKKLEVDGNKVCK